MIADLPSRLSRLMVVFLLCQGGCQGANGPVEGDPEDDRRAVCEDEATLPQDLDEDGFPLPDDCNDLDPLVYPGADDDQCDGVDQDCDGQVDQDVRLSEPSGDLGDLTDRDMTFVSSYLFPADDQDAYRFALVDTLLGYVDMEVWLYAVPEDADYALELRLVDAPDPSNEGLIALADANGPGGEETINFDGTGAHNDSGTYEVTVRSVGGESCSAPYFLQLISGSL